LAAALFAAAAAVLTGGFFACAVTDFVAVLAAAA
jgi:hypothetical protein